MILFTTCTYYVTEYVLHVYVNLSVSVCYYLHVLHSYYVFLCKHIVTHREFSLTSSYVTCMYTVATVARAPFWWAAHVHSHTHKGQKLLSYS